MFPEIVKAFLIGICASAPLGPIAILVMQKSLTYGRHAGFVTGLGATTVDTTYATISIFALALAQSIIAKYTSIIYLGGGIILVFLGYSMAFKDPFRKMKPEDENRGASLHDYLQAVATALSNPGAIFVMLALFAFFGMEVEPKDSNVFPLILAVAGGSASYWFFFSWFFGRWRSRFNMRAMMWMNRVGGLILMIIGTALFGQGLFAIVFQGG